jgi:DNA mismatch repair protein MutL
VGKPESAKKKGAHDYFFVNGRFMKHAYFHKAVMQAFERLVSVGMQVPYFIYFEVAPSDIDVNIHPTKTEIKFENEQAIWQILVAAVKDAIGKFCEIPQIDFDTVGQPDIPAFNPVSQHADLPQPSYNPSYNPFKEHQHTERPKKTVEGWEKLYEQLPQHPQESPVE